MPRNSRLSSIAAVAAFFLSVAAASAASVIFVDKDATGPVHDGTSWCQAYTSLSEAINVVEPGYTIRVANGTYKPDSAGLEDPRHASFPLQTGVRIEGGYAGCGAPDPDARNLALYETILDGDTKDDDSPPIESDCFEDHEGLGCDNEACEAIVCAREPDCCESELPSAIWFGYCAAAAKTYCCEQFGHHCDNTYHVVTAIGTDESAVLDGFTVTGGFAGGASGNARRGGGVNLEGASSTFATCTISGNASISYGGGIHIDGGSPTFEDCDIAANISHSSGGGGVRTTWAAPVFTRCTTTDNHALSHGGGLSLGYQTYATASHCTLARNTTESSGGAIYTYSAALSLTDTLIADNSGRLSAGMYASFSTVAIRNSKIVGNGMSGPTAGIGGIHARYSDVTIISSLIAGNVGSGNGGLGASYSVVDILQSTIAFNVAETSVLGAGVAQGSETTLTIDGCILWGNNANGRLDEGAQIYPDRDRATVSYNDIQDWRGYYGGVGNFGLHPMFVDPEGPDGLSGTEDDDYRLSPGSPCINTGNPACVLTEGETDLDGSPRLQGCRVDLGAYETDTEQLLGDFNADDSVDLRDVASFQNCFQAAMQNPDWLEACLCVFDFDDDSVIDAADSPAFLAAFAAER